LYSPLIWPLCCDELQRLIGSCWHLPAPQPARSGAQPNSLNRPFANDRNGAGSEPPNNGCEQLQTFLSAAGIWEPWVRAELATSGHSMRESRDIEAVVRHRLSSGACSPERLLATGRY